GTKQKRDYLLESIVLPNAQIAKGYETILVTLKSGKTVAGIVKEETDKELKLMDAEGKITVVPKEKIDEREKGKSSMPEDLVQKLSKSEIRDLVEFLATVRKK